MPNPNIPNGFIPWSSPFGGSGQPKTVDMIKVAANSEIGIGSPVRTVADGVDLAAAAGTLGTGGVSAEYHAASGTSTNIKVWASPDQTFVAQMDDGTGVSVTAAVVGMNTTHVGSGVTNRMSTAELDESASTTTDTLQWRILLLAPVFMTNSRNAYGEFNRFIVKPNHHQLAGGAGHVGV